MITVTSCTHIYSSQAIVTKFNYKVITQLYNQSSNTSIQLQLGKLNYISTLYSLATEMSDNFITHVN